MWNNFVSPFFIANISVKQESTLSHILSALYIASIFYIFKIRSENFEKSNAILIYSYNVSFQSSWTYS